jgi:outer membrane protein assembly factor BamB
MFHHDLGHSGYSTSTAPDTNQTLWTYTTLGGVGSSPTVAGGVVYVGSDDGNVYALNASTGSVVWSYATVYPDENYSFGVDSSPAVVGNVVYVGAGQNVTALNALTGALVWNYTTGDIVESSPAVAGGVVYVGSDDGNVYALNASTGARVWNCTLGSFVYSSPAVAGGVVYVGSDDNVCAVNASTGALAWSYATGDYVESSPAVVGNVVYVGSYDGNVYALDTSTGTLEWTYTTGSYVDSSPAVAGGVVYVGSEDDNVYAFGSNTTYPWIGTNINFTQPLENVTTANYVYVSHGWEIPNWTSYPIAVQRAALDPGQANFTLTSNDTYISTSLTQLIYYNSTDDTMFSWFWTQFYPLYFAPGAYSFTGTWQSSAAANPPNYTAIDVQTTVTLIVNLASSSTSVSLSSNAVSIATPVNCTAEVSVLNGTGIVNWTTSSSTGTFSPPFSTLSYGDFSTEFFTTTYTDNNTGFVTIAATYSGDYNNLPSSGNTTLTIYMNVTTGTNVTVTPTNNITLTFANVTTGGIVVANATPTVQAPAIDPIAPFYTVTVTASFSGNVTVSVAFDGSGVTQQQKANLTMWLYTPIIGDIQPSWGIVDMKDVAYEARHFGTTPSSPNWDPAADINGDGVVNMKDIALVARHFGFTANWVNITTYVDTTNNIIYGTTSHFSFIGIHG